MLRQAEALRHAGGGFQFTPMPLAVIKRQADHALPGFKG
jgi:hypothetical protein